MCQIHGQWSNVDVLYRSHVWARMIEHDGEGTRLACSPPVQPLALHVVPEQRARSVLSIASYGPKQNNRESFRGWSDSTALHTADLGLIPGTP